MVLESVVSFLYEVVAHSWAVASIAVKYVLLIYVFELVRRKELGLESFMEMVEQYAQETVLIIVGFGTVLASVGVKPGSLIPVLSELIALGYFALLFWRY